MNLVRWLVFIHMMLSPTQELVLKEALRRGFEPQLVMCIVEHESGWNERAVGARGEMGLWQIRPATARYVAKQLGLTHYDLFDVRDNTLIGLWILEHRPMWFSTWERCQRGW